MRQVVTAAEMRRIEEQAAREGQTSPILMERAGRGAARAILKLVPTGQRSRARIVVLCGPGNNGGDGLIVARDLAARGLEGVCAYTYCRRPDQTPPEPSAAMARVRTFSFDGDPLLTHLRALLREATIVVDGLLGTGRARPIEGELATLLDTVREAVAAGHEANKKKIVVALDLPTGLNADTGELDAHALPADHTLTFGFAKRGLLLEPGAAACGHTAVVDIGVDDRLAADVHTYQPRRADVAAMIPPRGRQSNKYSAGAVLVVAGSPRFTGAPRLAALGAARAGAGLVSLATGRTTHPLVAATLVEMTFILLPDDPGTGSLRPKEAVAALQPALSRYRCVLIGPGLGQEQGTQETIYALLAALREMPEADRPHLLVDADGLNALAARERWWELLPARSILTPHAGEMGRLRQAAGHDGGSKAVEADRVGIARSSATEWAQVVVLKGAHTLVADPDGRVTFNTTGGPNLATGGTGDVLSGVIASLAAQGATPFEAAVAGVYLHGRTGDMLALHSGDRGTLAGDLPGVLPRTLHQLLQPKATPHDAEENPHES